MFLTMSLGSLSSFVTQHKKIGENDKPNSSVFSIELGKENDDEPSSLLFSIDTTTKRR
jgi:hypothetical protein